MNSFQDSDSLTKNYLSMLGSAPKESPSASSTMPPPPVPAAPATAAHSAAVAESDVFDALIKEIIKGEYLTMPLTPPLTPVVPSESPHLQDYSPANMAGMSFLSGGFDSSMQTSPLFDDFDSMSPLFADYTPNMSMADFTPSMDFQTSPLLEDYSPLIGTRDNGMDFYNPLFAPDGRPVVQPPSTPMLVNDNSPFLADLSSPQLTTPLGGVGSYDAANIASAPSLFEDMGSSLAGPSSSRPTKPLPAPSRRQPTGTRRNITPQALIPDDAPTQVRRYIAPSTTSRKEVPVTFARKRAAAWEDEDELPDLPPNATEKEQIEWKRRQNTIAARKSRKRKLEHQQNLETEVDRLKRDLNVWKVRAITLRGVLRGKGEDSAMEEWDQDEE